MMSSPGVVRVALLGPLEVSIDGRSVALGGVKPRLVLARLALDAGRVVSTERLVATLWGADAGSRASATLQVHVSNLRSVLRPVGDAIGHDPVQTVEPGYRLDLPSGARDLDDLDAALAVVKDDLPVAEERLAAALDLFRGHPLEDLAQEEGLADDIRELVERRRTCHLRLVAIRLHRGLHDAVVPDLATLVAEDPLDERARLLQVTALYRAGRQADALRTYELHRQLLAEELGVDPGPRLQQLHERILRHDADLLDVSDVPDALEGATTVVRPLAAATPARLRLDDQEVLLDRATTTIGRRSDRHVIVRDPDASREHAEIRRDVDGYLLVDVGSANGCLVNGTQVVQARLDDGDMIQIGSTMLRFESV